MKVETTDSFFESLEKLAWYDTKLWKVWEFIRRTIPRFFKNIWRFRKELASHEWWDYRFTLEMLYRSLTIMVIKLEFDGIEEDSSRMKKVNSIKRTLELLKHKLDDDYVERAEAELGSLSHKPIEFEPVEGKDGLYSMVDNDTPKEKAHAKKVYKRAQVIEEIEWNEIWDTIKGSKFTTIEEFNGSGMRGWWD